MRNQILVSLLLFSFATTILGQNAKYELGLLGGFGRTNFDGSDFIQKSLEPANNLYSEISFQIHWSNNFSLRSGIALDKKGATHAVPATDAQGEPLGDLETNYNLDYISIPILLQYNLEKTCKYYAFAGGYFSHLIHQETVVGAIGPFSEMKSDEKDNYRLWDFGLTAGLGCSYPITEQWRICLESRFSQGLNDIVERQIFREKYMQNQAFHFLLGLSYNFKAT